MRPACPTAFETWLVEASDLAGAVFVTQFASLKEADIRDDMQQSAVLECARIAPKLAAYPYSPEDGLGERGPNDLFKILYSVMKFAMLRVFKHERKHSPPAPKEWDEVQTGIVRVDALPGRDDEDEPAREHVEEECDAAMAENFARNSLPREVLAAVDRMNIYRRTPHAKVMRFCALMRLQGRHASPSFVRQAFRVPDPHVAIEYGEFLARGAILHVATDRRLSMMLGTA